MPNIQHKRGTRAALDALAASSGLVPWQVYAISDENRIALALTASTYQTFLKTGEVSGVGYYVGPTSPDPATYPLWLNTTAGAFLIWTGGEWMEPGANYVPPGGSTGQVLQKLSGDNFDVAWGSPTAPSVAWDDIAGKPTTFAPSAHTHAIADVTGLETALGGKEPAITKSTGYAKWSGSAWTFVDETYLASYTETDPTVPAHVKGITSTNVSDWNSAFGWGDHASAGYAAASTLTSHIGAGGAAHAAATTTTAGFMSAADKTKLDGIASGATANTGTVTSVGISVPAGLQVAGSPVTASGTLAVTLASGYSIPTTTKQSEWDTAYGWGNHASAGYLTSAAIGSSVQAYSANLTSWASLTTAAKQDAITISATAPASPTLNQLWFDIS